MELVPEAPMNGCPNKKIQCEMPKELESFVCPNTCYCEDHCSWQHCSLNDPPMECFDDIDGTWFRKNEGDPWVAKFNGNKNYAYIHTYILNSIIEYKLQVKSGSVAARRRLLQNHCGYQKSLPKVCCSM